MKQKNKMQMMEAWPGSDEEEKCENPWEKVKEEMMDALEPVFQKQMEPYLEKDVSQDVAEAQAVNDLLPAYRKKIKKLVFALKWYRCLKQDPIHRQVVKTLRKFMDKADMVYKEAMDYTEVTIAPAACLNV